jgi:hypothetical protein
MAEPSPPEPGKPGLPGLPIVTLEPWEQRSRLEKYGSFYYLALGGLVLLVGMIGWFAWGAWSLREVWRDVYLLHDPARSEADRVEAAGRLASNPDATQRQRYDIALNRDLPDRARYLMAEALTAEAAEADPRGYALAVSRSGGEGWPDWFRLLMLRPLAYGAGAGAAIEQEPLAELLGHGDPSIRLWACYTLAESNRYNARFKNQLRSQAAAGSPGDLAAILVLALDAEADADRVARLDEATQWVRDHHPGAAAVWSEGDRPEAGIEADPTDPGGDEVGSD